MKVSAATKKLTRGLTLVEALLAIAIVVILGLVMFATPKSSKARALRINCLSNLKQIGTASRLWAGDHGDKFPWDVAETNGGAMEPTSSSTLWRNFQVMSNELGTPKVLFCLIEESWTPATNFVFLNNSNISYFINLDATNINSRALLSGDRNITNGAPIENGILKLTPNHRADWTAELHPKGGNILFADGSVLQVSVGGLQNAVAYGTTTTNHLLIPIRSP